MHDLPLIYPSILSYHHNTETMPIKETTVSDEEAQTREPDSEIPGVKETITPKDTVLVTKADTPKGDGVGEAEYPEPCYCPLTKKVMIDPVVAQNGESYEKETIMSRQGDDSLSTFYPNRALKAYIDREKERVEEIGSLSGTIRSIDSNLRNGWDKLVEKTALPFGESRPLPDGEFV